MIFFSTVTKFLNCSNRVIITCIRVLVSLPPLDWSVTKSWDVYTWVRKENRGPGLQLAKITAREPRERGRRDERISQQQLQQRRRASTREFEYFFTTRWPTVRLEFKCYFIFDSLKFLSEIFYFMYVCIFVTG